MKKEFFADIPYNKTKRRNGIILNIILVVLALGSASTFAAQKDWVFTTFFTLMLLLPAIAIPGTLKNYPTNGKPVIEFFDNEIRVTDEKLKYKDIIKVKIILELDARAIDITDLDEITKLKEEKPSEELSGDVDVFYRDAKGKQRVAFSHVKNAVQTIESFYEIGIKFYEVVYSVNKNNVESDFDFVSYIANRKQKENSTSSKNKAKQLIKSNSKNKVFLKKIKISKNHIKTFDILKTLW